MTECPEWSKGNVSIGAYAVPLQYCDNHGYEFVTAAVYAGCYRMAECLPLPGEPYPDGVADVMEMMMNAYLGHNITPIAAGLVIYDGHWSVRILGKIGQEFYKKDLAKDASEQ